MATRSGRRIDIKKKRVKPLDNFAKDKRKVKEDKKKAIPKAFIKISVLLKDTQEILGKKKS